MKLSFFILLPVAASASSWFSGSDPAPVYTSWSNSELSEWLRDHNLPAVAGESRDALLSSVSKQWDTASTWSQNQYNNAQKTFSNIREDSFDKWDESTLRSWLLEQGVVAPKDKKEELVLLAKQRQKSYQSAAQRWSDWASGTVTSYAATASKDAERVLDDSKDYIYSTWDDSKLQSWLVEKGVIKSNSQKKRDELLALMKDNYVKVADPVWESWSDSYIREWLNTHNLFVNDYSRPTLTKKMSQYYYTTSSYVWDSWTESNLRDWLVENNVISRKEADKTPREKLVTLVSDAYTKSVSTVLAALPVATIRAWLVSHDYITDSTAAKANRASLVKLVKDKLSSSTDAAKEAEKSLLSPQTYRMQNYSFLTWPDNRIRAFLHEAGLKPRYMPQTREGLMEKMGEIWATSAGQGGAFYERTRDGMFDTYGRLKTGGKEEPVGIFEKAKVFVEDTWDKARGEL